MMDVYMVLALAGGFGILFCFAHWCGKMMDGGGGA